MARPRGAGVAGAVATDIVATTAWNGAMADLAATGHVAGPAVATFGQQTAAVSQAAAAAAAPPLAHAAAVPSPTTRVVNTDPLPSKAENSSENACATPALDRWPRARQRFFSA